MEMFSKLQSRRCASGLEASGGADMMGQSDAPDYYDIIKRPMDLKTIRARIRDGNITSIDEFERDVLLMFAWVLRRLLVPG